jgi:TonB family protein
VRRPDAAAIARFYPEAARQNGIEGRATIECGVGPGDGRTGDLVDCRVFEESPVGEGFGPAALSMAFLFRMQIPKSGYQAGGRVRIPIHFLPAAGRPQPSPAPARPDPPQP